MGETFNPKYHWDPETGDYYGNGGDAYSVFWYVVPAGSAYVDMVNGKLQVVKP